MLTVLTNAWFREIKLDEDGLVFTVCVLSQFLKSLLEPHRLWI